MTNVEQARKIILRNILPLKEVEFINLNSCLGRISALDIKSKENIPPFNNSAMDGFALRARDSVGASRQNPEIFEVIEDLPAGYIAQKAVKPNQAIRIMTGAPLPRGADSVVMVEDTALVNSQQSTVNRKNCGLWTVDYGLIRIFKEVKKGENVRYAGEDVRKGEAVIRKGSLLKSGHIGVLASLGITRIKVFRRPRVGILATGDELINIKRRLTPGKIRNSNTYSLYAQAQGSAALPIILGIAGDTKRELEKKIKKGLNTDMLLVSGGISVGDYDLVKDVLKGLGTEMKFWKVAMRPGKPLAFGMMQGVPVFGLPGNPVSSMVSFEIFVRPAILKMLGQELDDRKEAEAVLEEDIRKKKGFKYFLRAHTRWQQGRYLTKTTGPQGSAILKSFVLANSLIVLPEEKEYVKKGEKAVVRFLD